MGTWAQASYRAVLGPNVPVHVLPYVCATHEIARCPTDDPVVGFVGSLVPRKGLDLPP